MTRLTLILSTLVAILFIAALLIGPAHIGPVPSLRALILGGDGPMTLVMREIRLPRALLGLMIGGALGLAGAAMQGYLRNPLADPGLIGVSGSAALGAVLAIQTGFAATWALDRTFTSRMSGTTRATKYHQWQRAVQATLTYAGAD